MDVIKQKIYFRSWERPGGEYLVPLPIERIYTPNTGHLPAPKTNMPIAVYKWDCDEINKGIRYQVYKFAGVRI